MSVKRTDAKKPQPVAIQPKKTEAPKKAENKAPVKAETKKPPAPPADRKVDADKNAFRQTGKDSAASAPKPQVTAQQKTTAAKAELASFAPKPEPKKPAAGAKPAPAPAKEAPKPASAAAKETPSKPDAATGKEAPQKPASDVAERSAYQYSTRGQTNEGQVFNRQGQLVAKELRAEAEKSKLGADGKLLEKSTSFKTDRTDADGQKTISEKANTYKFEELGQKTTNSESSRATEQPDGSTAFQKTTQERTAGPREQAIGGSFEARSREKQADGGFKEESGKISGQARANLENGTASASGKVEGGDGRIAADGSGKRDTRELGVAADVDFKEGKGNVEISGAKGKELLGSDGSSIKTNNKVSAKLSADAQAGQTTGQLTAAQTRNEVKADGSTNDSSRSVDLKVTADAKQKVVAAEFGVQTSNLERQVNKEPQGHQNTTITGGGARTSVRGKFDGEKGIIELAGKRETDKITGTEVQDANGNRAGFQRTETNGREIQAQADLKKGEVSGGTSQTNGETIIRTNGNTVTTTGDATTTNAGARINFKNGEIAAQAGQVRKIETKVESTGPNGDKQVTANSSTTGVTGEAGVNLVEGKVFANAKLGGGSSNSSNVQQTNADGTSTETNNQTNTSAAKIGISATKDSVTGTLAFPTVQNETKITQRDANGNVVKEEVRKTGVGGSLALTADDKGNVTGSGALSLTQGANKLGVGASVTVGANTQVKRLDDQEGKAQYEVTQSTTLGGTLNTSNATELAKGKSVGAGIGLGAEEKASITRKVDQDGLNKIQGGKPLEVPKLKDISDPNKVLDKLQVGDKVSYTRSGNVSVSVEGSYGPAKGGLQGSISGSFNTEIERLEGNKVKLSVKPENLDSARVFAGDSIGFTEVSGQGVKGDSFNQQFVFDLNTKEGKSAYEDALKGKLPGALSPDQLKGDPGEVAKRLLNEKNTPGVQRVSAGTIELDKLSAKAEGGLPFLKASIEGTTGNSQSREVAFNRNETTGEVDSVTVRDRNEVSSESVTDIPFFGRRQETSTGQIVTAATVAKDGSRQDKLEGVLGSEVLGDSSTSSADLNRTIDQINKATGLKVPPVKPGEDYGSTNVRIEAEVTPAQLDALVKFDASKAKDLTPQQRQSLTSLQAELKKAGAAVPKGTQNYADQVQIAQAKPLQDRLKQDSLSTINLLNKTVGVQAKVTGESSSYTDALREGNQAYGEYGPNPLRDKDAAGNIDDITKRQTRVREQVENIDRSLNRLNQDPLLSPEQKATLEASLTNKKAELEKLGSLNELSDARKAELFSKIENQYFVSDGEFDTLKDLAASTTDPKTRAKLVSDLADGQTSGRYGELIGDILQKTPANQRAELLNNLPPGVLKGEVPAQQLQDLHRQAVEQFRQDGNRATVDKTLSNLPPAEARNAVLELAKGLTPAQIQALPLETRQVWAAAANPFSEGPFNINTQSSQLFQQLNVTL